MLKIAVCGVDKVVLEEVVDLVGTELTKLNMEYDINTFSTGEDLLDCKDINCFDIVFLEVELGTTNGINIAKKLRNNWYENIIVFIASSIEYASLGYRVEAFRFILKCNLKKGLSECVCSSIPKLGLKKIKIADLILCVKDILYIESDRHQVIIHFENSDTHKVYDTLDSIEKKLNSNSLIRVHKSYLINVMYMLEMKSYGLKLKDGTQIPIPKSKYRDIKMLINMRRM